LGAIRGIVMPATLIGNGLGPPAIGYIYDATGSYTIAWWLLMVLFFISAAIVTTARPPSGRPTPRQRATQRPGVPAPAPAAAPPAVD
jgi:hypothetical protein